MPIIIIIILPFCTLVPFYFTTFCRIGFTLVLTCWTTTPCQFLPIYHHPLLCYATTFCLALYVPFLVLLLIPCITLPTVQFPLHYLLVPCTTTHLPLPPYILLRFDIRYSSTLCVFPTHTHTHKTSDSLPTTIYYIYYIFGIRWILRLVPHTTTTTTTITIHLHSLLHYPLLPLHTYTIYLRPITPTPTP